MLIDTRTINDLKDGIIPNSLCIAFDGGFANWVGTLLDPADKLIIFGNDEQAEQSIKRLLRIGYINVLGHANFPISEWKQKGYEVVTPAFYDEAAQPGMTILDVRKPGEWKSEGVAEGAVALTLEDVFKHVQIL